MASLSDDLPTYCWRTNHAIAGRTCSWIYVRKSHSVMAADNCSNPSKTDRDSGINGCLAAKTLFWPYCIISASSTILHSQLHPLNHHSRVKNPLRSVAGGENNKPPVHAALQLSESCLDAVRTRYTRSTSRSLSTPPSCYTLVRAVVRPYKSLNNSSVSLYNSLITAACE